MTILADLLSPRSIAIVGASNDPTRIGGRPVAHLINQRFGGAIYPVNPHRATVQGLPSYASLSDIPASVDFVLIAVPASSVQGVLREAIAKAAKTVLIFSSGFAETGETGMQLQTQLVNEAHASGTRIIGPNCLGLFNSAIGFYPTFTGTIDRATPHPGGIAIASQSGAYGSHIHFMANERGLGVHYWVTTGNEADVSVAECIELFAQDDDVHTILAYAESVKPSDGERLITALKTARSARKPVIFMKVGRSSVGAQAASSHTASMAGEDRIYDAVLRQYGAVRAHTTEQMLDIAYACRPRIFPAGKRLGVVTISGGAGVLIADAAADYDLDVAPMPEPAQEQLKHLLPFAEPRNPVDVTAQFFNDMSLIPQFTKMMLEQGKYDGLIGFWTSVAGAPSLAEPLLRALSDSMRDHQDTLFLQTLVAPEAIRKRYEDAGLPCYEDPSRAVTAMAAVMAFGQQFAHLPERSLPISAAPPLPAGALNEQAAKALLAGAGIPVVSDQLVQSPSEARSAVAQIGRAALKISSAQISHKTEVGGVALNVDEAHAAQQFEQLMENAARLAPAATIDGVLVSPMLDDGIECLLGARCDPVFGPVVLFGLGGVFTETLNDVAFRHAPFGPQVARDMIDELRGRRLFDGVRGAPAVDITELAEIISRMSVFAATYQHNLASAEVNPLLATASGCIALDALIEFQPISATAAK